MTIFNQTYIYDCVVLGHWFCIKSLENRDFDFLFIFLEFGPKTGQWWQNGPLSVTSKLISPEFSLLVGFAIYFSDFWITVIRVTAGNALPREINKLRNLFRPQNNVYHWNHFSVLSGQTVISLVNVALINVLLFIPCITGGGRMKTFFFIWNTNDGLIDCHRVQAIRCNLPFLSCISHRFILLHPLHSDNAGNVVSLRKRHEANVQVCNTNNKGNARVYNFAIHGYLCWPLILEIAEIWEVKNDIHSFQPTCRHHVDLLNLCEICRLYCSNLSLTETCHTLRDSMGVSSQINFHRKLYFTFSKCLLVSMLQWLITWTSQFIPVWLPGHVTNCFWISLLVAHSCIVICSSLV